MNEKIKLKKERKKKKKKVWFLKEENEEGLHETKKDKTYAQFEKGFLSISQCRGHKGLAT